jgi:hypothetical protein
MGKEFNTAEALGIIQINEPELIALDELALALIGGGEMAVSL